jgi:hypothetical protein
VVVPVAQVVPAVPVAINKADTPFLF